VRKLEPRSTKGAPCGAPFVQGASANQRDVPLPDPPGPLLLPEPPYPPEPPAFPPDEPDFPDDPEVPEDPDIPLRPP
jgi:hypothetical protein